MSTAQKLVSSIKYYVLCALLIIPIVLTTYPIIQNAHAQEPSPQPSTINNQLSTSYTVINPSQIPPQSPIYTNLALYNLMHAFSCLGVGQSVIGPCVDYIAKLDPQGKLSTTPVLSSVNTSGGLLGATGSLLTGLFTNPPLRTSDYLADVSKGFGIIPQAHAQVGGSGSGVLNPILKLWQVSRNISYLFLIIIFIIIGLMVMFRQKINPQTVITAQAAMPGLILGLILITFSYFFASLISDTAFIGTNLVGYYFTAAQGPAPAGAQSNLVDKTANENVLSIFSRFVGIINKETASDALNAIWEGFGEEVQGWLRVLASAIVFQQTFQATSIAQVIPKIGLGIQAILSTGAAVAAASKTPEMVGLMLSFIAILILLYSMFKLLLRLINNFLTIIFLTISAPFQFLAASLPGRQGIATGWILNMLCNVLAFPAVIAVFYFVAYLLKNVHPDRIYTPFDISSAVYIGGSSVFPLFGGLNLNFINILLAFGALIATPSIPDIICRAIGRVGQAGQLIGQEVGTGVGGGQRYTGQFNQGLGTAGERGGQLWFRQGYEYDADRGWIPSQNPLTTQPGGLGKAISRLASWGITRKKASS